MEFAASTWRPEASLFYRVDDKILTEAEAKDYKLMPEQLLETRLEISN
jgi:hypothetical protein